jgi:hypothetical protein
MNSSNATPSNARGMTQTGRTQFQHIRHHDCPAHLPWCHDEDPGRLARFDLTPYAKLPTSSLLVTLVFSTFESTRHGIRAAVYEWKIVPYLHAIVPSVRVAREMTYEDVSLVKFRQQPERTTVKGLQQWNCAIDIS